MPRSEATARCPHRDAMPDAPHPTTPQSAHPRCTRAAPIGTAAHQGQRSAHGCAHEWTALSPQARAQVKLGLAQARPSAPGHWTGFASPTRRYQTHGCALRPVASGAGEWRSNVVLALSLMDPGGSIGRAPCATITCMIHTTHNVSKAKYLTPLVGSSMVKFVPAAGHPPGGSWAKSKQEPCWKMKNLG